MCAVGTVSAWIPKRLIPESQIPLPGRLHYSQILKASRTPWRAANKATQSPRVPEGTMQPFPTSLLALTGHRVLLPHTYPEPHRTFWSSGSCCPWDSHAVSPCPLHAATLTLSPAAQTSSSAAATGPTVKSASRAPLIPVTVAHQTPTLTLLAGWLPGRSCGPAQSLS